MEVKTKLISLQGRVEEKLIMHLSIAGFTVYNLTL